MSNTRRFLLAGILTAALSSPVLAEEEWQHEVAPYVWAVALDGKVGVNGNKVNVDIPFHDVLDYLDFVWMGAYRASQGPVFFIIDTFYAKLSDDKSGPDGVIGGDLDLDQTILEFDAGYRVLDQLELFGGMRYNKVTQDLKVYGPSQTISANGSLTWLDPLVGARYIQPLGERWNLVLRGDVGGFGVGSNYSYQLMGTVGWKATDSLTVSGGYRYLDQDVDEDKPIGKTLFDVALKGPIVGVIYKF